MATFMTKVILFSSSRLSASPGHQIRLISNLRFPGFAARPCAASLRKGRSLYYCHGLKPPNCRTCKDTFSNNRQEVHTSSALFVSGESNVDKLGTENLLQAWFNEVNTYGTVSVHNVHFDVHIQPLNPVDYPDLNKSIVKMYYDAGGDNESGGQLESHRLSEMAKLCDLKVCVEGDKLEVRSNIPPGVRLPLVCVISVPLKFDVEIKDRGSTDGRLTISKMESDNINVHLEQGDCHLISLKTASVRVQCDEGSITSSKQLLGAIHLSCGKLGSIKGDRLQGMSIQCATEDGDIDIKTVYAETTRCTSQSGHLHIRDCHGDVTATSASGNLTVDSLDGKFSAELGSGSADVFIARQDGVNIHTKEGDVMLRFSEDVSCSLDLDAQSIEQDDALQTTVNSDGKGCLKSESECVVKASARQGKISLKKQDWLSSIKLQFGKTTS